MATRLPPVHALSAFEAAARHNSFAVAAEELCITPSALSHRIRLLEEFVGERLFHRDGRSIDLSEFGRRYLDVVRTALRTLTDFPMPHRNTITQPKIRVMLPPTFTRHLLMPRITDFMREHPEISVELYLSVPLYDLSLSECDVEIRFGNGHYPGMVAEKLFEEPVFAVASPAYLKTIAPIRQPEDLKHANLLYSALEPWAPWFEVAGLSGWTATAPKLRIDDLGLLLEAARHGYGVALTRPHFAKEMLEKGDIVELFDIRLQKPPHSYYVVHEPAARKRAEVDVFVSWLQKAFSDI